MLRNIVHFEVTNISKRCTLQNRGHFEIHYIPKRRRYCDGGCISHGTYCYGTFYHV